jgi:hypothetical protein
MFKNLLNKEDNDYQKDDNDLEEMYQKLYKKIARDFVHREDFKEVLGYSFSFLRQINPKYEEALSQIDLDLFDYAVTKAIEYKENLSKPRAKRKKYKDVDQ